MASQTFFAMGFGGSDWSAVRRCALSADWPAGESCVPEEAGAPPGEAPSAASQRRQRATRPPRPPREATAGGSKERKETQTEKRKVG